MATLKLVEDSNNGFVETVTKLGVNQLSGIKLKYTKVDRDDTEDRPYAHLFSSFNLPITENQKNDFDSFFSNTALSGVNQSQIIVAEVPVNEYGELIDGKTIEMSLPIYSGGTRRVITCFSTFFNNPPNPDSLYSDPNTFSNRLGVVENTSLTVNESNVAYLFSNEIATPKNGGTWGSGNFRDGKKLASYSSVLDEPVGIAYLDKGFMVFTNQEIVQGFDFTGTTSSGFDGIPAGDPYTGTTGFTQVYFNSAMDSELSFNSIKTELTQNITCIVEQNEFNTSNNPTFRLINGDTNSGGNPTYITEIGLYNANQELIAIAKPNQPIPKTNNDLITFQIQLKL